MFKVFCWFTFFHNSPNRHLLSKKFICKKNPHLKFDFLKVLQKDDEEVLPKESCFNDDEYELMKRCWKRQRNERIELFKLQEGLKKMRSKMKSGG